MKLNRKFIQMSNALHRMQIDLTDDDEVVVIDNDHRMEAVINDYGIHYYVWDGYGERIEIHPFLLDDLVLVANEVCKEE